jgi:K(+)-stimulated pyrophosphate-energized sodium pump
MEKPIFLFSTIVISLLAFGFAFLLYAWLRKQPAGSDKIKSICSIIRKGANTFLTKEYLALAKFAGVLTLIIFILLPKPIWTDGGAGWLTNLTMAVAYIFGNVFSAIAGRSAFSWPRPPMAERPSLPRKASRTASW